MWEATFAATNGAVPVDPRHHLDHHPGGRAPGGDGLTRWATAILVAPVVPELYAGRSRRDVTGFFEAVAGATPLPLILFNYPSLTGVDLTADFLSDLARIEHIRYVKESTGDSRRVHAIHRRCEGRIEVICGNPNAALESLALGCRAWITGIMNVVPRSARAADGRRARGPRPGARAPRSTTAASCRWWT